MEQSHHGFGDVLRCTEPLQGHGGKRRCRAAFVPPATLPPVLTDERLSLVDQFSGSRQTIKAAATGSTEGLTQEEPAILVGWSFAFPYTPRSTINTDVQQHLSLLHATPTESMSSNTSPAQLRSEAAALPPQLP
jgi:hypothetical protein